MDNPIQRKGFIYRNRVTLLGVAIVVITHIITMIAYKCGVFGDNVYVGGDNQLQVLGYASEFRRKITEGEFPFYSWRSCGGIDFYSGFIGSICNVTMLILSFFPYKLFNDACDVVVVVYSVLMFLTMKHYLVNREFGKRFDRDSYEVLLFSVPYAIIPAFYNVSLYCTYLIAYTLMPIVILGLERLVANKGWRLYFISLSLLMINNFYAGAIGCIFIVLYYLTLEFKSVRLFVIKSIKITLLSALAVLTSAFSFIPLFYTTTDGGYGFSEFQGAGFYVNWLKVLDSAVWGSEWILAGNYTSSYWESNLYAGTLVMLLTVSYFAIKRINLSVRIRKLAVLALLLLGVNGKFCNYVIHLFHYTHGMPNRHVLYIVFYVLTLASDAYIFYTTDAKKRDKLNLIAILAILILLYIISNIYNGKERVLSYIVCIALSLIYTALLICKRKMIRYAKLIISVITMLELVTNYTIFFVYPSENFYANDTIESIDSAFKCFDVGDEFRCGYNDGFMVGNLGMVYGYNCVSGFSGSASIGYCNELKKLGVNAKELSIGDRGFNSFLNAIFSRKYVYDVLQDVGDDGVTHISKNDAVLDSEEAEKVGDVLLYKNKETLNPIIVADGDMSEYNDYSMHNTATNSDVLEYNNLLCYSLTGVDKIFTKENVDFNVEMSNNCNVSIKNNELIIKRTGFDQDENGSENDATVVYSFVAPQAGEYVVTAFDNYNLGYRKKGETVYVYAAVKDYVFGTKNVVSANIDVNRVDRVSWNKAYSILKSNQMDIDTYEAGYIKGIIDSPNKRKVFTTIPYDNAWKIIVDGHEVSTDRVGDGFLAFQVDKGVHEVELKFFPRGVILGCPLSIIAIMIGVVMVFYYRKGKKVFFLE